MIPLCRFNPLFAGAAPGFWEQIKDIRLLAFDSFKP